MWNQKFSVQTQRKDNENQKISDVFSNAISRMDNSSLVC